MATDVKMESTDQVKASTEIQFEPIKINFYRSPTDSLFIIAHGFKILAEKEQVVILKGKVGFDKVIPLVSAMSQNGKVEMRIGEEIPLQPYEKKDNAKAYKLLSIIQFV